MQKFVALAGREGQLLDEKHALGNLLVSHLDEVSQQRGIGAAAKILRDLGISFEDAHVILLKREPRGLLNLDFTL